MNRILKNVFFTLIFLFGIGILVGCKVKEDPKIILGVGSDIEINYEEVKNLDVYLDVEEKIVIKYTSSNKEIVTVDQEGNVKGVDIGDATIKITLEGYPNVKAEVKVKVKANELSINGDTEVFAGEEIKLIAVDEKGGSDVIWDSEDNSIATVTQDGTVTGKSVGTVNIIIVSSITGEVKMLEINVIKPDVESIDVTKRGSGRILLLDEV